MLLVLFCTHPPLFFFDWLAVAFQGSKKLKATAALDFILNSLVCIAALQCTRLYSPHCPNTCLFLCVWLCGCVFVCLCATHTHTHSLALAPHPPLLPLTLVLLSLLHRRARAALRRVLTREGVPVFSSLDQALPHVARMAKHNRPEQCQRQQQRQAERMPGATALPFLHQHETHIRANARGMTALIEVG